MKIKLKSSIITSPAVKRRYPKQDKTRRLGEKAPHDVLHNCLSCARSPSCKDTNKSLFYRCTRFREATLEATTIEELFKNPQPEEEQEEILTDADLEYDKNDEESIFDMISKVINSNAPVPPDFRINDKEIPLAKNFQEWVYGYNFGLARGGQKPFPRQVEIGTKLFAEYCPRCSDVDWFDEMPVDAARGEMEDRVVFLENGICPECNATRSEMIVNGELNNYYGVVGLAGQRSAKTTSAILWDTYDLHKTLKIPNPQAAFNMLSSTPITSTFAATTFAQAVDNVWTPYLSTVKSDAPWFDNYHKFLDRKGEELGEELYSVGEHMIRYRHRNIVLTPSGPNKRTMRGKSRRSGLVDEIGWFKLAKKSGKVGEELELMDAKGVFDALNNSLLTLKQGHTRRLEEGYNDLPKPVMYLVSSPSAYNDFIMTAYRMYQQSTEMYAFKYATWEYNPLYKKTDKIFSEGFRLKPVETARDYECNPPIGEGLFINGEAPIRKAMKTGPNKISVTARKGLSKAKVPVTNSSLRLLSNSLPSVGTILCIDVGLVNNSLAFSIVGPKEDYSPDDPMEDVGSIQTPAQVYAVGEIIPYADTKINLTSVYQDCFVPLLDPFDIRYMVSDRWNNAKIASDLDETYGVVPLEHKCRWGDFEATRDLLYSGNLILPKTVEPVEEIMKTTLDNYPECFRGKPVDHLAWQFLTVKEQTNVTVLKGDGGTDDLFRTVVLGVAQLQDPEILEELLQGRVQVQEARPIFGLLGKLKGGGASSNSSMITNNGIIGMLKKRR